MAQNRFGERQVPARGVCLIRSTKNSMQQPVITTASAATDKQGGALRYWVRPKWNPQGSQKRRNGQSIDSNRLDLVGYVHMYTTLENKAKRSRGHIHIPSYLRGFFFPCPPRPRWCVSGRYGPRLEARRLLHRTLAPLLACLRGRRPTRAQHGTHPAPTTYGAPGKNKGCTAVRQFTNLTRTVNANLTT